MSPGFSDTTSTVPPAASIACLGENNSSSSNPSVARIASFLPAARIAMNVSSKGISGENGWRRQAVPGSGVQLFDAARRLDQLHGRFRDELLAMIPLPPGERRHIAELPHHFA